MHFSINFRLNHEGTLISEVPVSENGSFKLPIVDKIIYITQVHAPTGYIFEPKQHQFSFDGRNDICSRKMNLTFVGKMSVRDGPLKNQAIESTTDDDDFSTVQTFATDPIDITKLPDDALPVSGFQPSEALAFTDYLQNREEVDETTQAQRPSKSSYKSIFFIFVSTKSHYRTL